MTVHAVWQDRESLAGSAASVGVSAGAAFRAAVIGRQMSITTRHDTRRLPATQRDIY